MAPGRGQPDVGRLSGQRLGRGGRGGRRDPFQGLVTSRGKPLVTLFAPANFLRGLDFHTLESMSC